MNGMKKATAILSTACILLVNVGCMTVSDSRPVVSGTNASQTFANGRVAMLPIRTQSSLAPDSVMGVRTEINRILGQSLKTKMPKATISDIPSVAGRLNQAGGLAIFEQIMQTYENTGVFDQQKVSSLGDLLSADYLLMSRLKVEKMDLLISKGMGGSLDLSLISSKNGNVVWAGSGEWKRGGVLGFGGATDQEAALGLVTQALDGLR